jgi:tetratricopeptide (TPR) repeat protein
LTRVRFDVILSAQVWDVMTVTDERKISSPDIEAYQAMKLLEAGDSQGAIKKCVDAISQYGDNRNCYLVKARVHIEQEEYGFAEEALQNVLRLDPEHPAAWAMLGEVYFRLGRETKMEYCRNRLEDLFPALTEEAEPEEIEADDLEPVDEVESADDGVEAESEAVSTDEAMSSQSSFDDDMAKPVNETAGSIIDESLEPKQAIDDVGEFHKQQEKAGGLKTELFETATFADICISQGKYEKALQIYQRLLEADPDNERYKEKIKIINEKRENNDSK